MLNVSYFSDKLKLGIFSVIFPIFYGTESESEPPDSPEFCGEYQNYIFLETLSDELLKKTMFPFTLMDFTNQLLNNLAIWVR